MKVHGLDAELPLTKYATTYNFKALHFICFISLNHNSNFYYNIFFIKII